VLFMVAAGAVLWNFRIAVKSMRDYYSSELHTTSWAADTDGGSRRTVATGVAIFTLCLVSALALALPSKCMQILLRMQELSHTTTTLSMLHKCDTAAC
jgi:hypothetical protein